MTVRHIRGETDRMAPPLKPHPWQLAQHMLLHGAALLPLALVSLGLGMAIYHWAAGLDWADAFLNAAMLLGGMGPVDRLDTALGKWLAGIYALFAGIVFLVIAGAMLAPVVHHVLHRFRLEGGKDPEAR
jgi:hypothetical protein